MNRREFAAAGLAGLGVVALAGTESEAAGFDGALARSGAASAQGGPAPAGSGGWPAEGGGAPARAGEVAAEGGAVVTTWESHDASAPAQADVERATRSAVFASLLAPLGVGSAVEGATVVGLRIDDFGVGVVTLRAGSVEYDVNVFRRSEASGLAVATTGMYDIFVRNEGAGSAPTTSAEAAAVDAVASAVAANESTISPDLTSARAFWAAV